MDDLGTAGARDASGATGALAGLAELHRVLAAATSRDAVLAGLRDRLPALLPGARIVLNLQLEDPATVEAVVVAQPLTGETLERYTRPTAGSALARARDVGAHRVDLRTSRGEEQVELASHGYTDRAAFPITFGASVVGSLAVTSVEPLTDTSVTVARLVAAVVSAQSFWFAVPGATDPRSLVTQVAQLRQAAHSLERTDPLTRLPNRVAVFEAVAQARRVADRGREGASGATLAFIDLDHYKIVNDSHGHAVGDDILVALADRLRDLAARWPITFGRVGGDEFTALANLGPDELRAVLEELAGTLQADPLTVDGAQVHTGFSAGIYPVDGHQDGIEEIVSRAENAAYEAKREGRGRIVVRRPGDAAGSPHLESRQIQAMREAVRAGRVQIVVQPIHAVHPGSTAPMDAEALVRLSDENGATLLPDDFVALAEQYDVVNALDRAVVERVVALLRISTEPHRVSCNVSPHSLLDPTFVTWAGELIASSGIADRLVLELTERLPVGRLDQVTAAMESLRATGVSFALDDFGAGTTSYATLRSLPVDVLKIDGTLSRGALTSKIDRAMLRATVEVAATLGVRTIAEGIETSEQYATVAALGVSAVQGFYLGQPSPWLAR